MKKILSIAAALVFGSFAFSGVAHAAFEDINLGLAPNSVTFLSDAGTITGNISLSGNPNLVLNHEADLQTASGSTATEPVGTVGSFLAVHATSTDPGYATFTLNPGQTSLGFIWGTIDSHNSLTVNATNGTFTISGTDLLTAIGGVDGTTQSVVDISDAFGTITSVVFNDTVRNAFEASNFYESAVPLPAALPLFGAGLLGLGFVARRRQGKVARL